MATDFNTAAPSRQTAGRDWRARRWRL